MLWNVCGLSLWNVCVLSLWNVCGMSQRNVCGMSQWNVCGASQWNVCGLSLWNESSLYAFEVRGGRCSLFNSIWGGENQSCVQQTSLYFQNKCSSVKGERCHVVVAWLGLFVAVGSNWKEWDRLRSCFKMFGVCEMCVVWVCEMCVVWVCEMCAVWVSEMYVVWVSKMCVVWASEVCVVWVCEMYRHCMLLR